MIPIEKLSYAHIGRRVVDSEKDIGEIHSFSKDMIEVVYSGELLYLLNPEDLEFLDFPGGLTIEDIGSHWKDHRGDICTFVGSKFNDRNNTEYLVFNNDYKLEIWCSVEQFKSFTRIEEKEEYTLVVNRKVSKEQYEAITKILQDENNAQ